MRMAMVLHGVAGGWDELIIAVVAVGVLWVAVKLAGQKPAAEPEEEEEQEQKDPAAPPATKRG